MQRGNEVGKVERQVGAWSRSSEVQPSSSLAAEASRGAVRVIFFKLERYTISAFIAQLVEHALRKRRVLGSIPNEGCPFAQANFFLSPLRLKRNERKS